MKQQRQFELKVSPSGEAAYLKIPCAPERERKVAKNIRLYELIDGYSGPDVLLDFDQCGELLGIEILL